MEITTSGHEFNDAVRQIAQLFFNITSDGSVKSTLSYENGKYISEAIVKMGEKEGRAQYSQKDAAPDRRILSDIVKKAVFSACEKISDMPAPWGISTGIRPAKTARMMLDENKSEEEIFSSLINDLWITPKKANLCIDVAKKEREILKNANKNAVSIYIGIPFCPTRCAYCSFISQAIGYNNKFVSEFVDCLEREIEYTAKLIKKLGFCVETVYFGGGTPTALLPQSLDRLIKKVKTSFDLSSLKEFTVEAGRPDTITEEVLSMLRENSVGRISINPQTMNDKTLEKIGRRHSAKQVCAAFEMAKKYNFSINADLIAGLPGEELSDFKYTLDSLFNLSPDAVTLHTMYLKRAARLSDEFESYRFVKGVSQMVDYAAGEMGKKGYAPYYMYKQKNTLGNLENTAFCKEGHECLYNIYIMEETSSVFALGGGASTKLVKGSRIERIFNPKDASQYINRIDEIIRKKEAIIDYFK